MLRSFAIMWVSHRLQAAVQTRGKSVKKKKKGRGEERYFCAA